MLFDLFHVYSHFFLFSLRSLLFSVSLFCSRNLVSYSFWAGSDAWAGWSWRAGSVGGLVVPRAGSIGGLVR